MSGVIAPKQVRKLPAGAKTVPASIQAERAVLSASLLNGENFALIVDLLRPEDFYHPPHALIFQALLQLHQQNKSIDMVLVQDQLQTNNALDKSGGISYLLELQEDIPALGLIEQHANIIREKAVLRKLIQSSADIISSCYDTSDATLDDILDDAEKKIFNISNHMAQQNFVQLSVLLKKTFNELANTKASREGVTGIASGFSKFDEMTSGFQNGDLVILAARPSMGKTALALNMGLQAAKEGHGVGIFSLEMSAEQLTLRMLSAESQIPHQKIRNATMSGEEFVTLTTVATQISEMKIFVDDTPSISLRDLRARARKLKAQHNIGMIIIDYLQLIVGGARHENRTQEISAISRALKALAKELEVPVIALSQLSRSLESRMDKRPMLSDLRESGAIEQDGDLIMFVYRDVVYNPDVEHPDLTEIIIGKQRNGPIGTTYASFVGEITRFEDIPEH